MAFTLGDYAIDRIQYGIAENVAGTEILYVLSQLADATIDITAESKEVTDKDGNLIKKSYNAKTGTFTANNALLNTNIMAAMAGSDIEVATDTNKIVMPKVITVAAGSQPKLDNVVEGTVKVKAYYTNGGSGESFELADAADATHFAVATDGTLTLPTVAADSGISNFIVKFDRTVEDGGVVSNYSNKFPKTIKLTLKALYIDPCEPDVLKGIYIVLPSFQPSPETSINLTTDAQLEYSGDLQVDYCSSTGKKLYDIYLPDDEEDE